MAALTGLRCPNDNTVFTKPDGTPLGITVSILAERPASQTYPVGHHFHLVASAADVAQCPTCGDRWRFLGGDDPLFTKTRNGF